MLKKAGLEQGHIGFPNVNTGELENAWGAVPQLAQRMGVAPGDADQILDRVVPNHIAMDALGLMKGFSAPQEISDTVKALDNFNNLFKIGVLTWPARHVRDFVSGQIQNMLTGRFSPSASADAWRITRGGVLSDAGEIPAIAQRLQAAGIQNTPEAATDMLRQMIGETELLGHHGSFRGSLTGAQEAAPGGIGDILGKMPGVSPLLAEELPGKWLPHSLAEANPLNVRGVGGRTETTFAPAAGSAATTNLIDSMNRIPPFIKQLRDGVDPLTAAQNVIGTQFDYARKAFTPAENAILKRVAPFYSFLKGATKFTAGELAEHPGGGVAQAIRAENLARGSDWTPDYIQQTAAIPLGGEDSGVQRYLTGLGLMHEDPLNLIQGGVDATHWLQREGQELLGRSTPLIKGPVEFFSGRQFYSGRDLEDLDTSIGRVAQNIAGTDYPPQVPIWLDQLVSNSPAARVMSTVRALSDPRKDLLAKAARLGTGLKISDVDMDKQRSLEARQLLEDTLRSEPAVRSFSHIYLRPEDEATLSPDELSDMNAYRRLSAQAEQSARAQRKNQQLLGIAP
jgi:hypothetical protein